MFKICIFKVAFTIFVFNSKRFAIFVIMFIFTLSFMNSFSKILTRFDNELAMNPIDKCDLQDMVFVISFPFYQSL